MSTPFLGEIRMFGGNFAPVGWALCQGQLMSISENTALFSLIGTTYGGDGHTTFALPDLRGRLPVHQGQGPGLFAYAIGQPGGVESVTLSTPQIPAHTHAAVGDSGSGTTANPSGGYWAQSTANQFAPAPTPGASMRPSIVADAGSNQLHDNMAPFLAINFIIALQGTFPSQT